MHLIALHEGLVLFIANYLHILLQIPTHVFIHDRKQKEKLLIHTFLLNNAHTNSKDL